MPFSNAHLRIARPVRDLSRSAAMYRHGLGLVELGSFADHDGFDGVMLGRLGADHHFEFTFRRGHPVPPQPTPEDLLVLYVPDGDEWRERCAAMLAAGFVEVEALNPYWRPNGRTFADDDGYRVVLQRARWPAG
jgi:catechol 2,3-dioxygenase-like lactoylglutathione lyase family enzyme